MEKHMDLTNVFLTTFGALTLFFLAATFSTPAKAMSTTSTDIANTAAPITLAYYYGPRFNRGPYWRGWRGGWNRREFVCPRVCWRNAWGYVHCARRC